MRCLASCSDISSFWKWSRKWTKESNGMILALDVSTPALLLKMEAAAIASKTFFLSLRALKSVRSIELLRVSEPAKT